MTAQLTHHIDYYKINQRQDTVAEMNQIASPLFTRGKVMRMLYSSYNKRWSYFTKDSMWIQVYNIKVHLNILVNLHPICPTVKLLSPLFVRRQLQAQTTNNFVSCTSLRRLRLSFSYCCTLHYSKVDCLPSHIKYKLKRLNKMSQFL